MAFSALAVASAVTASASPAATGTRPPIDVAAPAAVRTATFAVGWFWGPDSRFGSLLGVVRTRVGYAGGETKSPTYRSIGDHTEAIQVDYDPKTVTYEKLLEVFWASHDPTEQSGSRQYRNLLFAHDDEQESAARASAEALAKKLGKPVKTEIRRFDAFWVAEDYHQKYALRADARLMAELRPMFPAPADFRDSTAVARLNGYVAGDGSAAQLRKEIDSLGVSAEARGYLESIVKEQPEGSSCSKE